MKPTQAPGHGQASPKCHLLCFSLRAFGLTSHRWVYLLLSLLWVSNPFHHLTGLKEMVEVISGVKELTMKEEETHTCVS